LDDYKSIFTENAGRFRVNEIMFIIRENSNLAEGIFKIIMDSPDKKTYFETKFVENLTLMFFDNPF